MTTKSSESEAAVSDNSSDVDRRKFLKVLGVSGAGAATLTGCSTDQVAKLVPYMVQSEQQIPGVPTVYASTCTECSTGCGLHVKTREARAIKLEGNPEHPTNAGKLCQRGQAGLQALYNPDRLGAPMARNAAGSFDEITWDDAIARLAEKMGSANGRVTAINGSGASTFSTMLNEMVIAMGGESVSWQTFGREAERAANRRTWGRDDLPAHDFGAADYIVSFGADFLETWGDTIAHQRQFAHSHGFGEGTMARHVYVGPRMNLTGANADEWLDVPAGTEVQVALCLARAAAEHHGSPIAADLATYTVAAVAETTGLDAARLEHIAEEFAGADAALAVAGGVSAQHRGAIDLCQAANLANIASGSVGTTVVFGDGAVQGNDYGTTQEAFGAMGRGEIALVLVHEANPLYTLPKSGGFADSFGQVAYKVSTSNMMDETAAACDLILPNLHSLERWDDLMPRAGVRGLMQPVMTPVKPGMHTGDVLLSAGQAAGGALAAFDAVDFETHLKAVWTAEATSRGATDTDRFWREALQHGGLYDEVEPEVPALANNATQVSGSAPAMDGDGAFALIPFASTMYHDGRGANKPWLLENPDPVTKITWQSWVELHPDTAKEVDVREGEIVEVSSPHGMVRAQVYVYPGIRKDTVAMPLGLGHTHYGRYAEGRGVNPVDLLGAVNGQGFLPYVATKVTLTKTRDYKKVSKTEGNPRQLGRGIIEAMPLSHAADGLTPKQSMTAAGHPPHEINTATELEAIDGWYEAQKERWEFGDYTDDAIPKWGMAVDLSRCTGCSACVTACYAENNIATVGEDEVLRGREMSWMRIERYWEGGEDGEPLEARFAPVMCQHCDNAPCEPVCPVYASYHTPDGLNGQVYNRCVGTRYCSNNCPFKVRYYNWLRYSESAWPEPLNLQLNPEVTVRARGVMEKCTFCIQRIRGTQHIAKLEDRSLVDGEVVTACQQACPSHAIAFGNVKDPAAEVVRWKSNPRGYTMLEATNVMPAVTYLAKVRHVEPVDHAPASGEEH